MSNDKRRYRLIELLSNRESSRPFSDEESAWLNIAPTGREFGSGETQNKQTDRFGIPESAFREAYEAHSHPNVIRAGMYVPTREEVATLSSNELNSYLIGWMWESPTSLIPNKSQIAEVKAILEKRPDAADFKSLIEECEEYLKPFNG